MKWETSQEYKVTAKKIAEPSGGDGRGGRARRETVRAENVAQSGSAESDLQAARAREARNELKQWRKRN